ncbi:endopeptidase La [Phaeodactylibacter luteus]|uniref:Lon protease n=1 Tax=Phaeodactylibacter luteus TaxID=1564516 RepID=A0A5C6RIR0_9BACT|nr:endopeptidase La [Phaeodactylibacter luteus]TXB62087.1 endopeptidase La [Phaeodactylibacter luteus]
MFDDLFAQQRLDDDGDFMPMLSIDEEEENPNEAFPNRMPLLALKNTVLFPGIVIPITVGRDKSIKAINKSHAGDRLVAVMSQMDSNVEDPGVDDLYHLGTIARILKLLRMPDGTTTAILQGRKRCELKAMLSEDPYMEAEVAPVEYDEIEDDLEFEALTSTILERAQQIIELSPNIPSEANVMLKNINNTSFLLNFIASNLSAKVPLKQEILEDDNLFDKGQLILRQLNSELQLLELKDQIESKVRIDIEKQQRDYFLNKQLKTIQEELGQNPQEEEINKLVARAKKKKWPEAVGKTFEKELARLRRMNPQVAEFSIQLSYLELLTELPWDTYTKDNFDLKKVRAVLDKDHFGLEKVKERILEHLAVLKLKGDMKAPILCLVGPPGVGKTSLGRSIARAIKREFIRMSLGGLHDESEIRGHRKTYIGALPGRIIQSLKRAGSSNPVFILDEIDKVGKDFRGDPSSALLEVLDPEQNATFYDNYLELEYDLSKVMFIATANSLNTIQPALLDRMEIIQVSGYSTEEKIEIAKQHLIPEQRKEHGLKSDQVRLGKRTIQHLIEHYTRESGVRSLNRQIAGVMRSIAKKVAMEEPYEVGVKAGDLEAILGPERFSKDRYAEPQVPGVTVGLAWTQTGGDILFVEASLSEGKGKMTITGNLGDVMKESTVTALSFIKANAGKMGIDTKLFAERDIHLHVPEGAIPKDGPSAGITMLTALASAFTGKPVKPFVAMTGEITLRGKVLPVGGIKEKVLAAKRAGMKEVIMCSENRKHVEEINQDYISGMQFHYVTRMEEVLKLTLGLVL